MFHRLLRPPLIRPSSTRAYSLFSKPPGGRFFNSSKPPKVVPTPTASNTRVDATNNNNNANDPQQSSSSSSDDPSTPPSPVPEAALPSPLPTPHSGATLQGNASSLVPIALASHPPLSAPDLRLHQFFSQHRPLVLSQPASSLFDSSKSLILGTAAHQASPSPSQTGSPTIDNPPETTPEADADTARLLARSLAMNAVSTSVSWDATMRRLGLGPAEGERSAESVALEDLAVRLDSTQRKRRKKMKKHKCVTVLIFLS